MINQIKVCKPICLQYKAMWDNVGFLLFGISLSYSGLLSLFVFISKANFAFTICSFVSFLSHSSQFTLPFIKSPPVPITCYCSLIVVGLISNDLSFYYPNKPKTCLGPKNSAELLCVGIISRPEAIEFCWVQKFHLAF